MGNSRWLSALGRPAGGCALLLGAASGAIRAEDLPPPAPVAQPSRASDRERLTGDWEGLRTTLAERGVGLEMAYTGEALANLSGGLRRGAIAEGLLEMALELDTEKLGGWRGGRFRVSSLSTHGASLSRNHTGDLLTLSNIDAYDSIRLYDLWFEQRFFDGRFSVRFGQMRADEEFTGAELGEAFLNSGFGWPAFVSANTLNTGPAFFAATPGVRLRCDISPRFYAQAAVYDGDSFDSAAGDPRVNAAGTRFHLGDRQGYFSIAETGYKFNQEEGSNGLPGLCKLGAWLHTGDFADNYRDFAGNSLTVSGLPAQIHGNNFGAYLAAEQMIWREADAGKDGGQGLGLFCRVGASPPDRAALEWVVDGGASYTGLIPGRDEDVLALGAVYARVSGDIRRQQTEDRDLNGTPYAAIADHETVIEATYRLKITKWWTVQPDAQYIIHPGGSGVLPNAFVAGIRTGIVF